MSCVAAQKLLVEKSEALLGEMQKMLQKTKAGGRKGKAQHC